MSNAFCRMLSNGFKINVEGDRLTWRPCCFFASSVALTNQLEFSRAISRTSTASTWLPECSVCKQMEESGTLGLSPRLASFRKIPIDVAPGKCAAIEINIDLLCNAACLSCGRYASTTWKKYEVKHKLIDISDEHASTNSDRKNADRYFNELITATDFSNVQHVCILGGEPFYGSTQLKILNHLNDVHPALDQVVLAYQTNGSISPTAEVLELWKKFKSVDFIISIDGIGPRFEYLRWPLTWDRVVDNINFLLSDTDARLNVNATVSPLNVLYFGEIEDWVASNIPSNRLVPESVTPVRPNRCYAPLDLSLATPELREAVIAEYGPAHKLSTLFSNLEFSYNPDIMFNYINKHDQLRNLSWQEQFPAVVKYYKDFI